MQAICAIHRATALPQPLRGRASECKLFARLRLPGIDKFFEPKPAEPKPAEPKPEASEAENLEGLLARNAQWREHIFLYTVFIKWWGLKTLSSRR